MIIITKQKLIFNLIILVPIILVVGLFSSLFGNDNKMVSIICIAHVLMFLKKHLGYNKKTSAIIVLGLYMAIGLSSLVGHYSLILGIIFNFITIALTMYFTTEDTSNGLYAIFLLFYVFMEGTPIREGSILLRLASILLCGLLAAFIVYKFTPDEHCNPQKPTGIKSCIAYIKGTSPNRYYFILRMSLSLTAGMAMGHLIGIEKGMWINVTILSLTQLCYKETKERMPKRILGTLIGILLFVIIFNVILPPSLKLIGVIIGGYCCSIAEHYVPKVSLNTMLALATAMEILGSTFAISIRFCYMLLGLLITIILTFPFYIKESRLQNQI